MCKTKIDMTQFNILTDFKLKAESVQLLSSVKLPDCWENQKFP